MKFISEKTKNLECFIEIITTPNISRSGEETKGEIFSKKESILIVSAQGPKAKVIITLVSTLQNQASNLAAAVGNLQDTYAEFEKRAKLLLAQPNVRALFPEIKKSLGQATDNPINLEVSVIRDYAIEMDELAKKISKHI